MFELAEKIIKDLGIKNLLDGQEGKRVFEDLMFLNGQIDDWQKISADLCFMVL